MNLQAKAVEQKLYANLCIAKNSTRKVEVEKLRLGKVLNNWRRYENTRGTSLFVKNKIADLEKRWQSLHVVEMRGYNTIHKLSAAFCRAREVRRGNSNKDLARILMDAI